MAENRILDLAELRRPSFRRMLEELDRLVSRDPISYLHPGKRWEYPWALERADLPPRARVLDVGAGESIFPVYLARQGYRVSAVDLAFDGSLGRRHGADVEYVRGDMTRLPLASGSFDAVFCISVIEHLPDGKVPQALSEMRRVLADAGQLLLTTDYYEDASAEIWHRSPEREFRVDWEIFDEARLRRLILDAPGWEVEGDLDLTVDWEEVKPRMRAYHGYPYTSVGVKLRRAPGRAPQD